MQPKQPEAKPEKEKSPEAVVVTLAGRRFRSSISTTIEQDNQLWAILYTVGITQMSPGAGEAVDEYAQRVHFKMIEAGNLFEMLGCVLVPAELRDEDWSPEVGNTTAQHLKHLRDREDKAFVREMSLRLLLDFISAGSKLLPRSLTSSVAQHLGDNTGATSANEPNSGNKFLGTVTSAPGITSLDRSQGMTRGLLKAFSSFRLWRRSHSTKAK
jgi:hypothetical protein